MDGRSRACCMDCEIGNVSRILFGNYNDNDNEKLELN
jgi:hypothetical protein